MDVSVCIVNYNTADLTTKCIKSVFEYTKEIDFEVIVVENGSSDGSGDIFKQEFGERIVLIENPVNRFFTGGFNDAIFKAKGKYALILNSDAYLVDNSVKMMFDFLESNSDVGAVEGCIIDEKSGNITQTATMELTEELNKIRGSKKRKFLNKKAYERYAMPDWDRKSDREVEVLCDAFMMVNTELFKKVGSFNEALKLYYTEEYISDKIRLAGYKLWHLGDPKVYHAWSSSTNKVSSGFIRAIYKTDEILYFELKK
ncbi:glycosyltransferase family 2 protein [Aliarcobacter skirrowii]|uniref:glycosyltransferase family 2 protein n=1 Tax=Aliarcobacter skirrowii TaxID=28200 RepID=UPI0008317B73|nr:glycosyltransferase family 2 protein [Aliarcobacter skirrowii]